MSNNLDSISYLRRSTCYRRRRGCWRGARAVPPRPVCRILLLSHLSCRSSSPWGLGSGAGSEGPPGLGFDGRTRTAAAHPPAGGLSVYVQGGTWRAYRAARWAWGVQSVRSLMGKTARRGHTASVSIGAAARSGMPMDERRAAQDARRWRDETQEKSKQPRRRGGCSGQWVAAVPCNKLFLAVVCRRMQSGLWLLAPFRGSEFTSMQKSASISHARYSCWIRYSFISSNFFLLKRRISIATLPGPTETTVRDWHATGLVNKSKDAGWWQRGWQFRRWRARDLVSWPSQPAASQPRVAIAAGNSPTYYYGQRQRLACGLGLNNQLVCPCVV
jgi:hypothetical protein